MSNEISNEKEEFVRSFFEILNIEYAHIQEEYFLKYREYIKKLDIIKIEFEHYLTSKFLASKPIILKPDKDGKYIVR